METHGSSNNHCLLCGTSIKTTDSWNDHSSWLPGANNNTTLNRDLWALFTLRNMLGYPEEKLVEMCMLTGGILVGSWFDVCTDCGPLVQEGMRLHQEIIKVQAQAKKILQNSFFRMENLKQESSVGDVVIDIAGIIRNHLREQFQWRSSEDLNTIVETVPALKVEVELNDDDSPSDPEWSPSLPQEPSSSLKGTHKTLKVTAKPCKRAKKVKLEGSDLKKERKKKGFSCEICGLNFRTSALFNYHTAIHKYFENPEKVNGKLKCKLCPELVSGPVLLRQHYLGNHATELNVTVFQCYLCPRIFFRKEMLNDHIAAVHKKQGRYTCETCGYVTDKKGNFLTHLSTHRTDRPCVCDQCGADFRDNRCLQSHIRDVHSSMRKSTRDSFLCKYCPTLSFVNKSLLERHMKEGHQDLYTFACSECENRYMSLGGLQMHQKIKHVENQEVQCAFCDVKVLSRHYLHAHLKKYCKKAPPGYKAEEK